MTRGKETCVEAKAGYGGDERIMSSSVQSLDAQELARWYDAKRDDFIVVDVRCVRLIAS